MKVVRIDPERRVKLLLEAQDRSSGDDMQERLLVFQRLWLNMLEEEGIKFDHGQPRAPFDFYTDPATGEYVVTQGDPPDLPF